MISLFTFHAPPSPCAYLPGRQAAQRYEVVSQLTAAEYGRLVKRGWRRFGRQLFRPECPGCRACVSLRVDAARFTPSKSQKRAWKANDGEVTLQIGPPQVTEEKLDLYDRFHTAQTERKDWPDHGPKDPDDYAEAFVDNPFPSEEWRYTVGGRLVGVGYVDAVPDGLSAIYFYHDPAERARSLGTFNVLSVIAAAAARRLRYVYLGYAVRGCGSLEYKANFRPYELFDWATGRWTDAEL